MHLSRARALRRGSRLRGRAAVLACAAIAVGVVPLGAAPSYAGGPGGGPVVLDGMDPVCHSEVGQATDGYIRTVLASIDAQTTNSSSSGIAVIGSDANTATCGRALGDMMATYLSAITPAPAVSYYGSAEDIDAFFSALDAHTVAPALIWIPDNWSNSAPSDPVQTALTSHASGIADFVNAGGGLFSNFGAYGWLTALLPDAVFNGEGCNGGPAVTEAGHQAFPELTDALVEACWHGYFSGDTDTLVPLVDWPYPDDSSPRVGVAIGGASVTLPSDFTAAAPQGAQRVGTTANISVTVKDSRHQPMEGVSVSFSVDSGPDAGSSTTVSTDSTGVSTFAIVGAATGTDVISADATVNGTPKSASTSVKWLAGRPAAPGTAAKARSTALAVHLTPSADDGGSPVRSFRVTASAPGLPTRTVTVPGAVRRVMVHGLRPKTLYRVSVVAINQVGASNPTSFSLRTLPAPNGVPMPALAGVPIAPGVQATLVGDGLLPYASAQLTQEAKRQLRGIAFGLRAAHHVRCEGHTDFGGSAKANLELSRARAAAVCEQLRKDGITAAATVIGRGDREPIVRHGNRTERAPNRRVIVTFVD